MAQKAWETARRFARNFGTYSAAAHVQRCVAETLIAELGKLTPNRAWRSVTELGCGTGVLTRAFLARFACSRLNLFDLVADCPLYLEDIPYASFTAQDLNEVEELPPADLVLSASCLQWLHDIPRLFRAVAASLPVGGLFAASAFTAGNLIELRQCGGSPLECPSAECWRTGLELSGFSVRQFAAWSQTLRFASALEALRHLKQTGVLIPANGSYRRTRGFLDRYEQLRREGAIPLTYTPVLWIAEKK